MGKGIKLLILCFVALLSGADFALATDWVIKDGDQNTVSFEAVGVPGFLKINGEGGKASGTLVEKEANVSGEVVVSTADFKTGIETRDKHMKEKYLGSGPAKFVLDPVLPNGTGFDFTGKLTIKGDTVPVKGHGKISTQADGHLFIGDFKVSLKSLPSVGVPSYMGVTIAEEVTVKVQFLAGSK